MFHNMGVEWAASLLGFLALLFLPIPFLFYVFGERIRGLSTYAPNIKHLVAAAKNADEESGSEKSQSQSQPPPESPLLEEPRI